MKTWFQNRRMKHKKNIRKQNDDANIEGKEGIEEDGEEVEEGDIAASAASAMIDPACPTQGMWVL